MLPIHGMLFFGQVEKVILGVHVLVKSFLKTQLIPSNIISTRRRRWTDYAVKLMVDVQDGNVAAVWKSNAIFSAQSIHVRLRDAYIGI